MRVLVVEDEVRMAALIRRGLEEDGYAVDVATNGPDGLWQAREFVYDAIVLDVMLPGRGRLRGVPAAPGVRPLVPDPDAHRPGRPSTTGSGASTSAPTTI